MGDGLTVLLAFTGFWKPERSRESMELFQQDLVFIPLAARMTAAERTTFGSQVSKERLRFGSQVSE